MFLLQYTYNNKEGYRLVYASTFEDAEKKLRNDLWYLTIDSVSDATTK